MDSDVFNTFNECYTVNQSRIVSKVKKGRILDLYHFEIKGDLNLVVEHLKDICHKYSQPIKINIAFGFILKTVAHNNYRFYHPSNNNNFFSNPKLIQTATDQRMLLEACNPDNILEAVYIQVHSRIQLGSKFNCMFLYPGN